MTELSSAPDGYVEVLAGIHREEAVVVGGLLDSSGIRAVIVGSVLGPHHYTRSSPTVVSVYVPADRAEEARALVSETS